MSYKRMKAWSCIHVPQVCKINSKGCQDLVWNKKMQEHFSLVECGGRVCEVVILTSVSLQMKSIRE